jgi:phosphate transport system permease protein
MSALPVSESNPALYRRRKFVNAIGLTLSMLSMALGLIGLLWILWTLAVNGVAAFNLDFFTKSTPAPGTAGGGWPTRSSAA